MGLQEQQQTLRAYSVAWPDYFRISELIGTPTLRFSLPFSEGKVSIASLGERLRNDRRYLSTELINELNRVGSHTGSTLLLKGLTGVPFWLNAPGRRLVSRAPDANRYSRRAALILTFVLGGAGYRPIVERWDSEPSTFVHAKGKEYPVNDFDAWRFKLPHEPGTCHPNRPFGPSLFGQEKGGQLDAICPDIVAFMMVEKVDHRKNLGPYVFSVDQVEAKLDARTKAHLRETHYSIEPDPTLTKASDNGFGGVSKINVLGERGPHDQPDGRKYMRFILDRLKDDYGHDAPRVALKAALETIESEQQTPIDMQRGDILLVNNRRVATRWTRIAREPTILDGERTVTVDAGDRTLLRMCFYFPREIPAATT